MQPMSEAISARAFVHKLHSLHYQPLARSCAHNSLAPRAPPPSPAMPVAFGKHGLPKAIEEKLAAMPEAMARKLRAVYWPLRDLLDKLYDEDTKCLKGVEKCFKVFKAFRSVEKCFDRCLKGV